MAFWTWPIFAGLCNPLHFPRLFARGGRKQKDWVGSRAMLPCVGLLEPLQHPEVHALYLRVLNRVLGTACSSGPSDLFLGLVWDFSVIFLCRCQCFSTEWSDALLFMYASYTRSAASYLSLKIFKSMFPCKVLQKCELMTYCFSLILVKDFWRVLWGGFFFFFWSYHYFSFVLILIFFLCLSPVTLVIRSCNFLPPVVECISSLWAFCCLLKF